MDKECKKQIDEFNILWHRMLFESSYKDIEAKYTRIKGLSDNEISIIRIISEKEEVIIRDILEILNIPKSTLTNMIDRLEKRNLISRSISKRDRRSYKLELTEEGKKAQEEHIKFEEEVYGKIMISLDTYEERENLLNIMRKIVYNISNR
ncbi:MULTISPECIES: MarR family winged helix-turn-helix transcriptional regulator [Clostridium]|uniref:MarR family winged helix-turn-helix transcriptional regulator n=1 Tax=Candidatus Clostridium helianthi TaxID=3381660 RepID=A0ABW8S9R8_9CLOT|nr:MarR family transcriptional regulator [Clostridium beijerinckii]MBA8933952.1 DNA-binding MarR family transcriptional regulator [Clostridium beijerinckii]NRU38146.1 DNA-binding MarR family transcriptional regulator [Clostridium beijerinckii]NSA98575.1 DNA-binding MarR family transcriptional regulator [Clostridium beijerinckii]OOM58912.1 putative HTH-type transcriptional regulator YusO [Clostridium beijerinckii]OOM67248.1 putative HTH-type transcriptional regulator YusO [Clostridium beijerinc